MPERLNRLEIQSGGDSDQLTPPDVFERLIERALRPAAGEADSARAAPGRHHHPARARPRPARPGAVADRRAALSDRLARLAAQLAGTGGGGAESEWRRGLGRLLGDREALAAALAEQRRIPQIPPGMPIGGAGKGSKA